MSAFEWQGVALAGTMLPLPGDARLLRPMSLSAGSQTREDGDHFKLIVPLHLGDPQEHGTCAELFENR
jgi:hypothetical protein